MGFGSSSNAKRDEFGYFIRGQQWKQTVEKEFVEQAKFLKKYQSMINLHSQNNKQSKVRKSFFFYKRSNHTIAILQTQQHKHKKYISVFFFARIFNQMNSHIIIIFFFILF